MCAAITFPSRAQAFEPSTWAEVEDAATSRKEAASRSRGADPLIADVLSFTDAPSRCIHADLPSPSPDAGAARKRPRPRDPSARPSDIARTPSAAPAPAPAPGPAPVPAPAPAPSPPGLSRPPTGREPAPGRRPKRALAQVDDVLGLGRVNLSTARFVRRYTPDHPAPNAVPALPPPRGGGAKNGDADDDGIDLAGGALNLSSKDFSPTLYLTRLHEDSCVDDLRQGLHTLRMVDDNLCRKALSARAASHATVALAAAIVEQTRRLARDSPDFRKVRDAVGTDGRMFAHAGTKLDDTYRDVLDRQSWIDRLKQVQTVFSRFPWLLTLSASLSAAGKADVARVEETASLLLRAKEWTAAQDSDPNGPGRAWIEHELSSGLEEFIACLTFRLSRSSSQLEEEHLPRLVAVLESVGREEVIEVCMQTRLAGAKDLLVKASRPRMYTLSRGRRGGPDAVGPGDVAQLMRQLCASFIDGLADYWALANVVLQRKPRWQDMVDRNMPELINTFVDSVQQVLSSGIQRIANKDAALEVGRAYRRALSEVSVPAEYLAPVEDVAVQLVDAYLALLTRVVKSSAKAITRRCFETETVGSHLPILARALVQETVTEAQDLVDMEQKSLRESGDVSGKQKDSEPSDFHALAVSCVRVPEYVVRRLRALVAERSRGCHIVGGSSIASSSLRSTAASSQSASETPQTSANQANLSDAYGVCVLGTARCCNEFLDGKGIQAIAESVGGIQWNAALERQKESVMKRIRIVVGEVVRVYCKRLSPEVRWSARRIAELQSVEGLRTSHSMEIDSASTQAVEVLFNVCLAVCRARKLGATTRELRLIEKEFTDQIADVLLSTMRSCSSSGTKDMVAQIWVDIVFLMTALSEKHNSHPSTGKARDGFLQARDIAAAAIRGGGFAFGMAEEETLRSVAVEPSVSRARLMRQAVSGQWSRRVLPSSAWIREATAETIRRAVE